jgi:hypothetical protein
MVVPSPSPKRSPRAGRVRNLGRFSIIIALLVGFGLSGCFGRCEAEELPLEYQVKAAFLMNFTKFVQWPPAAFTDTAAPLSICILGDDPFGSAVDQLIQGEIANGRKLAVQRLHNPPPPKSCQVLFVDKSGKETSKTLAALGPGVLTVGQGDGFLHAGGMIAFVIENRRVRFDINQAAAQSAGLAVSSKLLNVARQVRN